MRATDDRAPSVRERQTVDSVRAHYAATGRPPSYKEIGTALGIAWPSQVDRLVKACVLAGCLRVIRLKGTRTEIRLTRPLEEVATADLLDELAHRSTPAMLSGNKVEEFALPLAA